jgi:hypothetical protein
MVYEIYKDVQCPGCGSTDTRDRGPYEVAFPAMTADHGCPQVHCMSCRRCRAEFDAGPRSVAAKWQALFDVSVR